VKIALDIQSLQTSSSNRGIGRYVSSMIGAIGQNHPDVELILIANGHSSLLSKQFIRELRIQKHKFDVVFWFPLELNSNDVKRFTDLDSIKKAVFSAFVRNLDADAFVSMSPFEGFSNRAEVIIPEGIASGAIIYDLIPYVNSSRYLDPDPRYKSFYHARLFELSHLDFIFTLSESEDFEVKRLFKPRFEPFCLGAGVDQDLFSPAKTKTKLEQKRVLVVGGADPRKNLPMVLEGFLAFLETNKDYVLQIVGDIPSPIRVALTKSKEMKNHSRFFEFLGRVSDLELAEIYRNAEVLIFASEHEGFGLPIIEAVAAQLDVVCLPTETNIEILGPNYLGFFAPTADSLKNLLEGLLVDKKSLPVDAASILGRFTWSRSAAAFVSGVKKVLTEEIFTTTGFPDAFDEIVSMAAKIVRDNGEILAEPLAHFIDVNFRYGRPQRVFVDVSELSARDAETGIQRVVKKVLQHLPAEAGSLVDVIPVQGRVDSVGYTYSHYGEWSKKLLNRHLVSQPLSVTSGDIFLMLDLQHHVTIRNESYLSEMQNVGVMVVSILYDLLPVKFPGFWPNGQELANLHRSWLHVIANSDLVLSISNSVKSEFDGWLSENSNLRPRTDWFHIGSDFTAVEGKNKITSAYPFASKRGFLMVGTLEPRKGHSQVLDAFEVVWNRGANTYLEIVGKRGWLTEDLTKRIGKLQKLGYPIRWLENASDEALAEAYKRSAGVIAASYGEGFGLPIVEAFFYEKPVFARDIAVFREVAERNAWFFRELDDLVELLERFEATPEVFDFYGPKNFLSWQGSTKMLWSRIIEAR
jgi:glycosyltransferase involved in cell wall biosynthesis